MTAEMIDKKSEGAATDENGAEKKAKIIGWAVDGLIKFPSRAYGRINGRAAAKSKPDEDEHLSSTTTKREPSTNEVADEPLEGGTVKEEEAPLANDREVVDVTARAEIASVKRNQTMLMSATGITAAVMIGLLAISFSDIREVRSDVKELSRAVGEIREKITKVEADIKIINFKLVSIDDRMSLVLTSLANIDQALAIVLKRTERLQ